MDYFRILGDNVRELRLLNGLTQEELSERCDMHRTYVGAIERGDRNVSLRNIVRLADALCVSPDYLLTEHKKTRGHSK